MKCCCLTTVLVGVALLCGMQGKAEGPKATATGDQPLWEIDLRPFGYERWLRKTTRPFPVAVDFTDVDHVAVGWTMPDIVQRAKGKGPVGPEAAHLKIITFNADTGGTLNKTEWPTTARYFSKPLFFGIPDGKLLICSDNVLRLLSPRFEVVKEIGLPNDASCLKVFFQHSPSRHTLLLSTPSNQGRQIELLDVEKLAILSSWTQEREASATSEIASISDDWQAGYCSEAPGICIRRFEGGWQPFHAADFDARINAPQRTPVFFLGEHTLAIEKKTAVIATVEGTVLFQIAPPAKHFFVQPVTSSGGERFALIDYRSRGPKSEPLDMYPFTVNDRASVYSIKDRRIIFSIKLKGTSPWTPWDVHDNFLALSPDGSSLAIVSDGVLKLYRLPGGTSEQH